MESEICGACHMNYIHILCFLKWQTIGYVCLVSDVTHGSCQINSLLTFRLQIEKVRANKKRILFNSLLNLLYAYLSVRPEFIFRGLVVSVKHRKFGGLRFEVNVAYTATDTNALEINKLGCKVYAQCPHGFGSQYAKMENMYILQLLRINLFVDTLAPRRTANMRPRKHFSPWNFVG